MLYNYFVSDDIESDWETLRSAISSEQEQPTRASDPQETFLRLPEIQSILAQLGTPEYHLYIEDSRLYLREIHHFEFPKIHLPDPFPAAPHKLIIRDKQLTISVEDNSVESDSPTQLKPQAEHTLSQKILQATKPFQVLQRAAETDSWQNMISIDSWPSEPSEYEISHGHNMRNLISKRQARFWKNASKHKETSIQPPSMWIFVEDHDTIYSSVLTALDLASVKQDQKPRSRESSYHFNLQPTGRLQNQWIVAAFRLHPGPEIKSNFHRNFPDYYVWDRGMMRHREDLHMAIMNSFKDSYSNPRSRIPSLDLSFHAREEAQYADNGRRWYRHGLNPAYRLPEIFNYGVKDVPGDESLIDLTIPIVSYAHFQKSRGYYLYGLFYTEYIEVLRLLRNRGLFSRRLFRYEDKLCANIMEKVTVPSGLPVLKVHTSRIDGNGSHRGHSNETPIAGFFNGIPADTALIDSEQRGQGFNLVSSRWVDWKSFTVHSLAGASDYPRITTPEGDLIQCSGWIRGKWASYDLQAQWVITQIFVVDATFATSGDTSSDTSNFLLSPKVSSKINQLSECLSLVGLLNPTLYRLAQPSIVVDSIYHLKDVMKGRGISLVESSTNQNVGTQTLIATNPAAAVIRTEQIRRVEWDIKHKSKVRVVEREIEFIDTNQMHGDRNSQVQKLKDLNADREVEDENNKVWDVQHQVDYANSNKL